MNESTRLLPGIPTVESPLFKSSIEHMGLSNLEKQIAIDLNENGFAVFEFPDDSILERSARIASHLGPRLKINEWRASGREQGRGLRVQDAWQIDDDVESIATNDHVISLLSKLYGKKAFPFQTLNFPVGTQQHFHSDSVHFSSIPERFMCGVWLALEDIGPDQGPLIYYPGSHKWPIIYNDHLGSELARTTPSMLRLLMKKPGVRLFWKTKSSQSFFMPNKVKR